MLLHVISTYMLVMLIAQQTQYVEIMLLTNAGPTLNLHCFDVLCLLGIFLYYYLCYYSETKVNPWCPRYMAYYWKEKWEHDQCDLLGIYDVVLKDTVRSGKVGDEKTDDKC